MVYITKKKVYCETCEREVVLRRKNFDHMYHEVLCILTIATLGIGYFILRYIKKKNVCPHCETEFDLNNLPTHDPSKTKAIKTNSIKTPVT